MAPHSEARAYKWRSWRFLLDGAHHQHDGAREPDELLDQVKQRDASSLSGKTRLAVAVGTVVVALSQRVASFSKAADAHLNMDVDHVDKQATDLDSGGEVTYTDTHTHIPRRRGVTG